MTAHERKYERWCVFCGHPFLAARSTALFCGVACMERESKAIRMLEDTSPPGITR